MPLRQYIIEYKAFLTLEKRLSNLMTSTVCTVLAAFVSWMVSRPPSMVIALYAFLHPVSVPPLRQKPCI
ncbi:hypothetical protein NXV89_22615 [Bacteroides uniformis]|nr:hypothetical protein [Bacteroides uniformis]